MRRRALVTLTMAASLPLAGCNKLAELAGAPTVTDVTVRVPAGILVGDSGQAHASATKSNGVTIPDLRPDAWRSSNPSVISIDKNGVVSGAYQNVLSGENSPISGQLDKKTQRVAWKIGTNNTVIETGLQNLSQDVASCLVHFGPDKTQTWLMVRQKQPEMPNTPETAEAGTRGS